MATTHRGCCSHRVAAHSPLCGNDSRRQTLKLGVLTETLFCLNVCGTKGLIASHLQCPFRDRMLDSSRKPTTQVQCSALLFDMDGVLINSTPAVARVWRRWAIEHGFNPEEVVARAHRARQTRHHNNMACGNQDLSSNMILAASRACLLTDSPLVSAG